MSIDPNEFQESLKEAFDDRVKELTLDTRFRELEAWDSLASVSTVAMVYAEFDVQISGDELTACGTVAELKLLVEEKLAQLV